MEKCCDCSCKCAEIIQRLKIETQSLKDRLKSYELTEAEAEAGGDPLKAAEDGDKNQDPSSVDKLTEAEAGGDPLKAAEDGDKNQDPSSVDIDPSFIQHGEISGARGKDVSENEGCPREAENLLLTTSGGARTRKVLIDKLEDANEAGGDNWRSCKLILTEGDSAKSLAMEGLSLLGRDHYGVFPLRGKLLNVKKASNAEITNSTDVQNIMDILGLKRDTKPDEFDEVLRYGELMIMTDQDCDGFHIKGLIINLIHSFWPKLLRRDPSFITVLVTPYVKALHETLGIKMLYSNAEFLMWKREEKDNLDGWTVKFYKGLGTSSSKEGQEYFSNISNYKKFLVWEKDDPDNDDLHTAFSSSKSSTEKRIEWIKNYVPDTYLDPKEHEITFGDFIKKELILYFNADLLRSIPSVVDGLKSSQRKILYCAFMRNLVDEAKVSQFAASVAECSSYHHAEQSLVDAIIGMAQDYVGKNNLNLLQPNGQFGTRNMGGKDAASARYISTKLSPATRSLFPQDDDKFLPQQNRDEESTEPLWFLPVIPTILINGAKGIGSGLSTDVAKYNPRDLSTNVRRLIEGKSTVPMKPWYRGFKGIIDETVTENGLTRYTSIGECKKISDDTVLITELPIGVWTENYKKFLRLKKNKQSGVPFIEDIKDKGDNVSVKLEVRITKGQMPKSEKDFIQKLGLSKTIRTNNMNLYKADGTLYKFENVEEILKDFYTHRLSAYETRKECIVANLDAELNKAQTKLDFVNGVLAEKIKVNNLTKADFVKQLEALFEKPGQDSVDYILELPIAVLISGGVAQLSTTVRELERELGEMTSMDAKDLWLKDLTSFDNEWDRLDPQETASEEVPQETASKEVPQEMIHGGNSRVPDLSPSNIRDSKRHRP